MDNSDQNREMRLQQLLIIIRLSLLFFLVIAFSQYYFKNRDILDLLSRGGWKIFVLVLMMILMYGIVILSVKVDLIERRGIFKYGELVFLGILSFLTVFYTGAFQSDFKPLFLCVILLAAIGHGLTRGMITAIILSLGLLIMDLLIASSNPVNLYFEYDLILTSIFLLVAFTVGYYVKMEKEHIRELRDLVNIDALTGLYNHRYFYVALYKQVYKAEKNDRSVSLAFFNVDDFKIYNDLYGYGRGDDALKKMARIMMDNLGIEFVASRYGGDEFGILMYDVEEAQAIKFGHELCAKIASAPFYGQKYLPNGNLTVSLGVSEYPHKANDANELVAQADEALYHAKFFRKNSHENYTSILDNLNNTIAKEDETIITTLRTLISVINSRDKYTYEHVERVAEYAGWIADELGLPKELKKILIYGGYLHDIGKINTPKEVLLKTDKLNEKEWEELKKHPLQGAEMIEYIEVMKNVRPLILQHHEQYNGNGYPQGLAGKEISYMSRILSVIDAFDAMTSIRPYQKKKTIEETCEELVRCRGTQFDPGVVDVFIKIVIRKFNLEPGIVTED